MVQLGVNHELIGDLIILLFSGQVRQYKMGNNKLCFIYIVLRHKLCLWDKTVPMRMWQDGPYILPHTHMVIMHHLYCTCPSICNTFNIIRTLHNLCQLVGCNYDGIL